MIKGWLRYAELNLKAKTGFGAAPVYWAAAAALALLAALVIFSLTAFIWLTELYGALIAAAIMAGAFLAIAIVSALVAILIRRQTASRAQRMLAAEPLSPRLDPGIVSLASEIGHILGWKKILPIAFIGAFAAGIAREWTKSPPPADKD
jgi:Ni/Fe-hydrogenase subunit HybB-like protein